MRKLLVALMMIGWACSANAATRYVNPTGSGSACSTGTPCSLSTGLATITGGDTLILQDGTYTGRILYPPSGSAGAYTIIRAANDGMAIITDADTAYGFMLRINGDYIQVEGIKFVGNSPTGTISGAYIDAGANYNKILRCGFVVTPCTECSNKASVTVSGNYNLVEDSWAWGAGRYKFQFYGGDEVPGDILATGSYNIFRRCVARHDREYTQNFNPQSTFNNYQGANNLFQNVLSLNSDQIEYYDNSWQGPFFLEKGQKSGAVGIHGSMALGFRNLWINDNATMDGDNPMYTAGDLTVSNSVGYDGNAGFIGSYTVRTASRDTMSLDHCLVGNLDGTLAFEQADVGSGFSGGVNTANNYAAATNNILTNIVAGTYGHGNALYNVRGASNYNSLYGNTVNYGGSSTAGANDITNVNPLTSSLRYPVRIEAGSPLKGAGSGGSDIGPTILKRIGVSGTLYGESGYNTVTSENLWPWPNETRIKADMSAYPSNWPADGLPTPTRGFTAGTSLDGSSQTLTKYVWEYLGNQIPTDIYGDDEPVNGTCGPSNGLSLSSAPTTSLCTTGTPSSVTGTGPWSWTCAGSGGGSTANCSASLVTTTGGYKWTAAGLVSCAGCK